VIQERPATPSDLASIHRLIDHYAAQGILLPCTEEETRSRINRFLVLEQSGRVVACASLEPYSAREAELRSLAVDPDLRGNGLGARMVRYALTVARQQKLARVFAVSHDPDFFVRQGFLASSRLELPQKIARDCCHCPRAAHCELGAAVISLQPEPSVSPAGHDVALVRI